MCSLNMELECAPSSCPTSGAPAEPSSAMRGPAKPGAAVTEDLGQQIELLQAQMCLIRAERSMASLDATQDTARAERLLQVVGRLLGEVCADPDRVQAEASEQAGRLETAVNLIVSHASRGRCEDLSGVMGKIGQMALIVDQLKERAQLIGEMNQLARETRELAWGNAELSKENAALRSSEHNSALLQRVLQ